MGVDLGGSLHVPELGEQGVWGTWASVLEQRSGL